MTLDSQQEFRTPEGDALTEWIEGVTGRAVVFDHFGYGGPRPDRPFCAMVISKHTMGTPEVEHVVLDPDPGIPETNLVDTATSFNEFFVSMNLVEGDPSADFATLRTSLGLQHWRDVLARGGLGYSRMVGPRDLSEIVKDDWQARQQADLVFHGSTEFTAPNYSIESVEITNNLATPPRVIAVP